ncbi:helix-turn-helix transcriptional regulator [Salisediminibacterium beveridgei]|uniref:Transcriptional regulator, PbsX family n=1 Tax=Salisediminibacterium beveridgei TaxID=632773 RepID=A0A1D7QRT6_9BACI|nr:helix-turn-helix transcriptional regulator [Salisediminibacterium beveridgei]AOM81722.1 transcriptional regulator, PbsX family [Salisediminibacterium beveridgei]
MNEHGEMTNQLPVLRAKHGYSQKDVAEKVGVSRQTIASLEKNKYNPSLKLAFELALLFEVDLQEVFQYQMKEES